MADFLKKHMAEVTDMILTDFNQEEYEDFIRNEAWEEGKEAGLKEGVKEGIKEGATSTLAANVRTLLKRFSESQVADLLEMSVEHVRKAAKPA